MLTRSYLKPGAFFSEMAECLNSGETDRENWRSTAGAGLDDDDDSEALATPASKPC